MERPNQTASLIEITPEIAKDMLSRQENYRKLYTDRATRLSELFATGNYVCDGNPLKLNAAGNLIDGQHRLTAIVRSGITAWFWVITGVADSAPIDEETLSRTFNHYCAHAKVKNANAVASAVGWYWKILRREQTGRVSAMAHGGPQRPAVVEMKRILRDNPSIIESTSLAIHNSFVSGGLLAALHYYIARDNYEIATRFVEEMKTTANKGIDDPIRRFQDKMAHNSEKNMKLTTGGVAALLVLTWNYWITGQSIRCLKYTSVGPSAQEFPSIILPSMAQKLEAAELA